MNLHRPLPPSKDTPGIFEVFRFTPRALGLVWQTSAHLCILLGLLSLTAGVLPAALAWVAKLIIDAVLAASRNGSEASRQLVFQWLALELALVTLLLGAQRGLLVCRQLLRAQLGFQVNFLILEKATQLELKHFEDSEFYDKLTRSRREASVRPMAIVNRSFQLMENSLSLLSYGGILLAFSPGAVVLLLLTTLPTFIAESRYSGEAFRLFRWRTPEGREQNYLEYLLGRERFAKEIRVFGLGSLFLGRYRDIYEELYEEDRDLTLRRGRTIFLLGLLSTAGFYGVYIWIALAAMHTRISIGEMTMYLMIFKQGQGAFSGLLQVLGGMYEDNLYLSTLYEYLDEPLETPTDLLTEGPSPGDGIRFDRVGFTYPRAEHPALTEVSFHIRPGEKLALVGANGSGKTTLIKLLTGLYRPTQGRILFHGLDIRKWDPPALREHIGVIFQNFIGYEFSLGENIGVGNSEHFKDQDAWMRAAEKGMVTDFLPDLPNGFGTHLGAMFQGARELSGGQWQRIALSRSFMRESADILILDEPTSAMDAEAEFQIFERLRQRSEGKMAVLISHRFSTVRMADHIVVLHQGEIEEEGSHLELLEKGGRYAKLFRLQAAAYAEEEANRKEAPASQ
jgi:ABC-type multidrug transport system fused ATPase/permease subunit